MANYPSRGRVNWDVLKPILEGLVFGGGEGSNPTFLEVTYGPSLSPEYDSANPNFYVDLAGDLTLDITNSISAGSGWVELVRGANGDEVINLIGEKQGNHSYPRGAGEVIRLFYQFGVSGLTWYFFDSSEFYVDGTATVERLDIEDPTNPGNTFTLTIIDDPTNTSKRQAVFEGFGGLRFGTVNRPMSGIDFTHTNGFDGVPSIQIVRGGQAFYVGKPGQRSIYTDFKTTVFNFDGGHGASWRVDETEVMKLDETIMNIVPPLTNDDLPVAVQYGWVLENDYNHTGSTTAFNALNFALSKPLDFDSVYEFEVKLYFVPDDSSKPVRVRFTNSDGRIQTYLNSSNGGFNGRSHVYSIQPSSSAQDDYIIISGVMNTPVAGSTNFIMEVGSDTDVFFRRGTNVHFKKLL